jgi:CBS domain-containing protein
MSMIDRILVGLDGSEAGAAAASLAGWLAGQLGARIRLVSVVEEPPPYVSARREERSEREAAAAYYAGVHREALARLQRRGLRADTRIEAGNEAAGLLAAATSFDAELIAIGHAGHSGAWGTGLGATAGRVAQGASSSVLVVRRGGGAIARLLVAYDGSPDASRAVELAAALAAAAGLDLVIAASADVVAERDPRRALDALRGRVVSTPTWLVSPVEGDPVDAVSAIAGDGEQALVLVGAHGSRHPWASGLGPVALGVLERAPASVMVVRPAFGLLSARRLMRSDPVTVPPDTAVPVAATQLLRLGIKCLPVVDTDGRPVGILTLGDLLRRATFGIRHSLVDAVGEAAIERELRRLAESGTTCRDIMTAPALTAAANEMVPELLRRMSDHAVKRLLIVDQSGVLIGIISRSDILRALAGAAEGPDIATWRVVSGHLAADVMRPGVATVRPETPGEDAARAVFGSGVGRVAVVDPDGRLVGVVATRDLLPLASDDTRHQFVGALGGVAGRLEAFLAGIRRAPGSPPTAADLMRGDVAAVGADASLGDVLRLMMETGLKRILVTDRSRVPIGVIDRADVVRALVASLDGDALAGTATRTTAPDTTE